MIRKFILSCLAVLSILALVHWLTSRWVDFGLSAHGGDVYADLYVPVPHSEERRIAWERFQSPHGEGGSEWKTLDLDWISAETWVDLRNYEPVKWERFIEVRVRAWLLFLGCAIYPTVAFVRGPLRRYRRGKRNQCTHCGYDLTGNTSGVCPECGGGIGTRPMRPRAGAAGEGRDDDLEAIP